MYKAKEGWNKFANIIEDKQAEEITTRVTDMSVHSVKLQNNGGRLTIRGVVDGTPVSVYNTNGQQIGSSMSYDGQASIYTNLQSGSVAIIKIGDRSVKVVIQ